MNIPATIPQPTAPEPLVPAGTSLRHLPMMFLDIVALQNSDTWALANGWEAKAAINLWMKAWHQIPAGSLPNDEKLLAAWAQVPVPWADVRSVAMRGFVLCSDGRLYHPVISARVISVITSSERGQSMANSRWGNNNPSNAIETKTKTKKRKDSDQSSLGLVGGQATTDDWPKDYQDQFWSEYPLKVAKARALAALDKVRGKVAWATLLGSVQAYKVWLGQGTAKDFRPPPKHPATWINGGCWDDDYGQAAMAPGPAAKAEDYVRADWERVARVYASTNNWPGPGPAPGKPGCIAPPDLFPPRPG